MYAAVERAIQVIKRNSLVIATVVVVGACNQSDREVPIQPEKAAAPGDDNATEPAGIPGLLLPTSGVEQPDNPSACPDGMVLVEGSFCPNPVHTCVEWKDDPAKYQFARCARYAEPAKCKGERETMRFCIDRLEAADATGLPAADVSWNQASAACQASGKRLCQEREWVFACEGEKMVPYPYGFTRDPSLCNFEISEGLATNKGELADKRQPVTANPQCLSPFGVANMVGNIDEWVVLDKPHYSQVNGGRKMMSGLKGGWWGPLRNRCRPVTVDHDEHFHELQTGYRCCADAG